MDFIEVPRRRVNGAKCAKELAVWPMNGNGRVTLESVDSGCVMFGVQRVLARASEDHRRRGLPNLVTDGRLKDQLSAWNEPEPKGVQGSARCPSRFCHASNSSESRTSDVGYGFKNSRNCLNSTDLSDVVQKMGISQGGHLASHSSGDASSHGTHRREDSHRVLPIQPRRSGRHRILPAPLLPARRIGAWEVNARALLQSIVMSVSTDDHATDYRAPTTALPSRGCYVLLKTDGASPHIDLVACKYLMLV